MRSNKEAVNSSTLIKTLQGIEGQVSQISWSPDGGKIAAGSTESVVKIWDANNGKILSAYKEHSLRVHCTVWSPCGQMIASGGMDKEVVIWNVTTNSLVCRLTGHSETIRDISWSSDSKTLATCSLDNTLRIWDIHNTDNIKIMSHPDGVLSLSWSPDGSVIATGSLDSIIRIWDLNSGELTKSMISRNHVEELVWSPDGKILCAGLYDSIEIWDHQNGLLKNVLEEELGFVSSLSFKPSGEILASRTSWGTVIFWDTKRWEPVFKIEQISGDYGAATIAYHPKKDEIIAIPGRENKSILIISTKINSEKSNINQDQVHYTNAKVVLVGDTGVGKSGLRLVLTNRPFTATESTHGRVVELFESVEVQLNSDRIESRETYLWDLAGQPGYRLVHQLSLNEVAVALVVFDSRNDSDPFSGVLHWSRALKQTLQSQAGNVPMKKFLVSARIDRGGYNLNAHQIEKTIKNIEFDAFFETSSKENFQIDELKRAIKLSIDWDSLPKVTSTKLFKKIQDFLVDKKFEGRILPTKEDLFFEFKGKSPDLLEEKELEKKFETCIGLLESRGVIRRLNFGGLVLLQPELLDSYAAAIIFAAKDEPDGLGSISEETVLNASFFISKNERIKSVEQEKLLLIATVEDLISHEIALRETSASGSVLVFPSQFTRELPEIPSLEGKSISFKFQGPINNIYSTLVVRLSRSDVFQKEEFWKNAARFKTNLGASCGMWLNNIEEGQAELTLFFSDNASEETRYQFEEYVWTHLKRRAIVESIDRRRIYTCSDCSTPLTEVQVQRRRERGYDWIKCNVCDHIISLRDREERLKIVDNNVIPDMEKSANSKRDQEKVTSMLKGKIATDDFDIFLAHNSENKEQVETISELLKQRGMYPWLDKEQIPPGRWFQDVIQEAIPKVKAAAIFIGKQGLGKWQELELRSFITRCVERGIPVIPVLLPGVKQFPENLLFLKELNWISFGDTLHDPDKLDLFEWGITGKKPKWDY